MNYIAKPHIIFLLALGFFPVLLFPQAPDSLWTRTFGGSNIDVGYAVQQTSDSGYIITGYTRSYGPMSGHNVWLIKTDNNGNEQWNNTFGGNDDDEGYSVQQTNDGGYIIVGYTKSSGAGGTDVYLIKADAAGNQVWTKTFGGASDDEGYSVQQTSDGGYIIGGATSSFGAGSRDIWLIKTDPSGNLIWQKTHGGMSSDGARSVQQTSDGGYILTGWTYSYGPGAVGNVWLVKTDSLGNLEWNNYFGGTDVDRGYWVEQTADGGFIITGYTSSSGAGLDDMLLIKTNSLGTAEWIKTFGGSGRDYGNSVEQTTDGGFIIAGYTLSYGAGGEDVYLVKTDTDGNEEWSETFGGIYSDEGYSVRQTIDGGFIITGFTLSFGAGVHDVWLIKVNSLVPVELISFNGNTAGQKVNLTWITASEKNNRGFEIERAMDTGYKDWAEIGFVEGKGTSIKLNRYSFTDYDIKPGTYFYRLKQVDFDGSCKYSNEIEINILLPLQYSLSRNYPNPFNPSTKISYFIPKSSWVQIKVFDALGNEISTLVTELKPAGEYKVDFDAVNLAGGVYFYQLRATPDGGPEDPSTSSGKVFIETKKMIFLK
jgi:hypothetical protein